MSLEDGSVVFGVFKAGDVEHGFSEQVLRIPPPVQCSPLHSTRNQVRTLKQNFSTLRYRLNLFQKDALWKIPSELLTEVFFNYWFVDRIEAFVRFLDERERSRLVQASK